MTHANNDKDNYFIKHPIFYGEKIDYWKDRIEIFFIGCDVVLWDMMLDGYTHSTYTDGINL